MGEKINGEYDRGENVSGGDSVEVVQAPISIEESLAKFLLEVKEKIDELNHILAGEVLVQEEGKDPKWQRIVIGKDNDGEKIFQKPIMKDDARRRYISILSSFCNRIFTLSYYEEYNDIMRVSREVRRNIGDVLVEELHKGNINCDISYLRVLRDTPTRMIESCLLWALKGGMRSALRQSMKSTEIIRTGEKKDGEKKFFKLF